MNAFPSDRRHFLMQMGALGLAPSLLSPRAPALGALLPGAVLGPTEGEHLVHFRDGGDIYIKVSGASGSPQLASGTQQVKVGTGIPMHRHPQMDEAFYVLNGSGTVLLDDAPHPFDAGTFIFIPRMTWHAFENPGAELLLAWIVSPPGLESFFRETCSPPGLPPKGLSRAQIREIAVKYGTEFR